MGKELLYQLKAAGIPVCLATSSSREAMILKQTQTKTDFEAIFGDNIVCGDDVVKGKPDPEIFQRAMEKIGCKDPKTAMVFEDAISGVEAGLAAGCPVCMVPDPNVSSSKLGRATLSLPSLECFDLKQFL